MRFHLILLGLLVLGAVQAEERVLTRRPLQAPKAQQLIEQLGSKDYKEREKASKDLATEGEAALPFLKAALLTTEGPEVQRRLEVLIDTLNSELAFRPTLVSIDSKNRSAKAIVKDLCKQAGYTFQESGQTDKKITLKLSNVPFWEATHAINLATGFSFATSDDDKKTISVYNDDNLSPYQYVNGPFRFTASNINSNRSFQLSNIPKAGRTSNQEYMNMSVSIQAEPKLGIVGIGSVTILKAVDDKGTELTDSESNPVELGIGRAQVPIGYRSLTQSCNMGFNRGSREATTIREFRAKVAVAILIEERPEFIVENILDAKKKKFSGINFDLEVIDATEAMGVATLKVKLQKRDANPNNDPSWYYSVNQRLVMIDDKGGKMIGSINEQNQNGSTVTMQFNFAPSPGKKAGKPSKLILNEWIAESREIEFKFKDIPIP